MSFNKNRKPDERQREEDVGGGPSFRPREERKEEQRERWIDRERRERGGREGVPDPHPDLQ